MRATVGLVLVLAGCGLAVTEGSGKPAHDVRVVSPFTKIDVGGALDVTVTRGTLQVELDGDDNLLGKISTDVHDGRLEVRMHGGLRPKVPLKLTVHMPRINELSLRGSSNAHIDGVIGDELSLLVSGSSTIVAAGTINHVAASISGSGTIDARALAAQRADAHISGSGTIDVAPAEDLAVDISGSGDVHYTGNPRIKKTITGSGSVTPL